MVSSLSPSAVAPGPPLTRPGDSTPSDRAVDGSSSARPGAPCCPPATGNDPETSSRPARPFGALGTLRSALWAGAHRPCSRRRRLQMRMFWVIVSRRLVPRVAGQRDARGRNPQSGPMLLAGDTPRANRVRDARVHPPKAWTAGLDPTARVVAASLLAGDGRWRDNEHPGLLAARSGQIHAVGHPAGLDISPASPAAAGSSGARRAPGPSVPGARSLPPGTGLAPVWGRGAARSGGQREVLLIRGEARPHRVRPADPLKPG